MNDEAAVIADRFLSARRAAAGLPDYPGTMPGSLEDAYAIQDAAIAAWRRPILGWKVGRVSHPMAQRFGANRLAGPIFFTRDAEGDGADIEMPVFERGFAAAEAEFLLRLGRAPAPGKASFSLAEAADLIGEVHVGIEIASSPLSTINELGPVAIISDFGNNNGLIVGPLVPNWRSSGFEDWQVTTLLDGEEVGSGSASAFPDGAIGSARFLFELAARRGIRLQRGQWISSGAATGVHSAKPGQMVEVQFGTGYRLHCRLSAARPE